jgi:hypothetical protein
MEALREHRHLRRRRLVGAPATVQEDEALAGSLLVVSGVDTADVDVLTHPVPPVSRHHLHVTVLQGHLRYQRLAGDSARRASRAARLAMGNTRITEDPTIDPRIKAVLGAIDLGVAVSDADSREQVLKEANTEQSIAVRDLLTRGRHRGAPAVARRNPVCRVTALLSHPNGRPAR